ncbi:PREDICTED: uncharacterized protein LOC109581008 isoform X2 [Amphimedon queenslandica]|uniref:TNFR-Cys domain-containing protein n=2 Tax=Amphimedon queenslandica TaxID=400682 RepID=A0AAN0J0M0_AMPQE|nr:PREDICTED: uncharacterized protein LOC109581008 isoform X2 [Amphimedon queenslandica]|eukprot:XP_019850273.1 PREDICTED: uncharacterized protein LOC109581008 isoform X2 [Amphimedon queenslandica]
MRSSSIIVAVFLVYQICFNAGEESGNCILKPISNNNNRSTARISNITVSDDETCREADNEGSDSNCTLLSESCSFSSCELLLNDSNKDDYCYSLTDSCILLSNESNCTITNTTRVSSSTMILTSTDSISPSLSDTTLTISSSTVVFTSVVNLSSESTIQHTSLQSKSSSILIGPSIPSSLATTSTISLSAVVFTSVYESTTQHTSSQSTSPSSVTVQPTFQLTDLIEEPLIYYWPPGLALLMLMCCACIFCLILCIRIRSWKSKMKAYKFVIAHDCGIQDLKYIDLPSRYDSKIEFTTFKNLSKLDNKEDKEDAEETELKAGATGEFGEGIPGVIIMESEPVTDLETQALITGEDNENTDEEKKEEKKDDAKDEPKDTSESKQQETGGLEVSIIIESSIINVEAKTTADAQTSGSDDTNCSSKESTTVDTSGIVDVTDGSTKQEVSPKQTMGDEKQSNREGEGKEGAERKPEEDVKKEESKMEDKQEAEKKDLSEDTLTKSMDVFNMQLGAILDLIKDDDKDTKAQTVL